MNQVNDIREGAQKSVDEGIDSQSPEPLISISMEDNMHERFIELTVEDGYRWSELKIWYAVGYIELSTCTSTNFGFPFSSLLFAFNIAKNLLFPIPNNELKWNPKKAASDQNPDY